MGTNDMTLPTTPNSDCEDAAKSNDDALESGRVEQETGITETGEVEEDIDEDLLELQKINKPLSSCVARTKFWCTFWIFPFLFVALNAFALSMFMVFDVGNLARDEGYWDDDEVEFEEFDDQDPYERMENRIRKNLLTMAIISFIDSLLLLLAKIHVLKDVKQLNEIEDGKMEQDGKSHVLGTVSGKFDKFFGFTRRPKTATMVGLLYNLTVIAFATSVTSFSIWGYLVSSAGREACSMKAPTPTQKFVVKEEYKIEGIPDDLQEWAQTAIGDYYSGEGGRSKGFVHLSDGRTFLTGSAFNKTDEDAEEIEMGYPDKILFSAEADGTLTRYGNVHEPSNGLFSVAGEGEENSEGFCCTFKKKHRDGMMYYRGTPATEILCVSSGENISEEFRNTTLVPAVKSETGKYLSNARSKAFDGQFWHAVKWRYNGGTVQREEPYTEFLRLNPATMEVESVANVTQPENGRGDVYSRSFAEEDKCSKPMALLSLSSLVVVLPLSLYVLIKKRMGAGVVPLALATCFIVTSFDNGVSAMMCVVLVLCTTISLILRRPRCFNREMLVHLHYTFVVFTIFDSFEMGFASVIVGGLALLAAMVLNHPILQIIGWIGGLGGALFFAMVAANPRTFGPGYIEAGDAMVSIPVCIVVGFGVVSIGTLLKRYRAYIIFYSRRLWALIRNAETNEVPPAGPPGAADVQGDEDRTLIT